MTLKIKPFIFSYYLPCSINIEELNPFLEQFKSKLHKQTRDQLKEQKPKLIIRNDGFAFLRSSNPMIFRLNADALSALKTLERNSEIKPEKLIKLISEELDISQFQVDSFLRLLKKYIGKSTILQHVESPKLKNKSFSNIPISVQWEITGSCNLKCVHCYADATNKPLKGEFSTNKVFEWIKKFKKYGIQTIHLLGGEPFMRKDIVDIIKKITSNDIFCYISTNGTLIHEFIAKKIANISNLALDVSLDGTCSNTHDSFRGVKGTFEKVLNGLHFLNKEDIPVNLTAVLGSHNISEINQIIELAKKYKAKRLQLLTFSPTGRGVCSAKKLGLNKDENKDLIQNLINLIIKNINEIYIDIPFLGLSPLSFRLLEILSFDGYRNYYDILMGCNAGLTKLAISPTGNIMLCPQIRKTFGNISKIGFLKGWENLNRYAKNNLICSMKECNFKESCGGKCRISKN